jgi:hypothetical protein
MVSAVIETRTGEHGLQGEQHQIGLCGLEVVIQKCDRDLGDGGGDLLRREWRGDVEDSGGLLAFLEDSLAIGGNAETPQQDFGARRAAMSGGTFPSSSRWLVCSSSADASGKRLTPA